MRNLSSPRQSGMISTHPREKRAWPGPAWDTPLASLRQSLPIHAKIARGRGPSGMAGEGGGRAAGGAAGVCVYEQARVPEIGMQCLDKSRQVPFASKSNNNFFFVARLLMYDLQAAGSSATSMLLPSGKLSMPGVLASELQGQENECQFHSSPEFPPPFCWRPFLLVVVVYLTRLQW
jgi:hypothetical protein